MNIDQLVQCKSYIDNWDDKNDITKHEGIIYNNVKYLWRDDEVKEHWKFMGFRDSSIISFLEDESWFIKDEL